MFGRQSALGARQSMGEDAEAAGQPAQPDSDAVPRSADGHHKSSTFTGKRPQPDCLCKFIGVNSSHVHTVQTTIYKMVE